MYKLRTIIIEDEPKAIDVLVRYCGQTEMIELKGSFRDPIKALEYLQSHQVELLLLDINMPKINGLELLDILEKKIITIFTTAYSEYALDSYDYNTADYLLKPIVFKRFIKAIHKAYNKVYPQNAPDQARQLLSEKTIYIKSGPQLHKVAVKDILYLEKEGNYLIFHTIQKKILSRQNMKDVFEILDAKEFVRIHKSYVIAVRHLDIIESTEVQINQTRIPIGRNYKGALEKLI